MEAMQQPSNPGDLVTAPLSLQGHGDTLGSKGRICDDYLGALCSFGYDKTAAALQQESGIGGNLLSITLLEKQMMNGKWDASVKTLHTINVEDKKAVEEASLLILKQKFLELLKENNKEALKVLDNQIGPLSGNDRTVAELSSCLTSIDSTPVQLCCGRSSIVQKVKKLIAAVAVIPERILESLVTRAVEVQRGVCMFHNNMLHQCGGDHIPGKTLKVLEIHTDEVWFVRFSHNGKYLASGSKDQSAIIWEVKDVGDISMKHRLKGHKKPVTSALWRPDDEQLLTCGWKEALKCWDVKSGSCLKTIAQTGVLSCGWFPDGENIVFGRILDGMTRKRICSGRLDSNCFQSWRCEETANLSEIAVTNNGKQIVSFCKMSATTLLYDEDPKVQMKLFEELGKINSFSLSEDNKFLLVTLSNQEIHLWNIEKQPHIVSTFKGHNHAEFIITSCFGGVQQKFVASGSEESKVYIWLRDTGETSKFTAGAFWSC